jgi:chemotaxis protein CheD
LGADRGRLVIKIAGGAQLLDQQGIFNIGSRNFDAVQKLIAQNGLKPSRLPTLAGCPPGRCGWI